MKVCLLSFTDRGEALGMRLASALGGEAARGVPAADWAARHFDEADALIFVGAAGIAVRAVAPLLRSKATDPAVLAVDEAGRFAVPLVGGHLGGANALARRVAALCGGEAVITTATDVEGRFAVDEWARCQGFMLIEPERILPVSARILRGETVTVASDFPVPGPCPPGVKLGENGQARLSVFLDGGPALHLVPRVAVLGVGCRKDTPPEKIEAVFRDFLTHHRLAEQSIAAVATLERKAREPGLAAFCRAHGWPLTGFPAEALRQVPGSFTASAFVEETVGVDNVCERSAVLLSGGTLLCPKFAQNGVTLALALRPFAPDWRWRDD